MYEVNSQVGRILIAPDDKQLQKIGEIVGYFAVLEESLSEAIWHLVTTDKYIGETITAASSFKNKVQTFNALLKYYEEKGYIFRNAASITKTLLEVEEQRNTIIHSVWGRSEIEGNVRRYKKNLKLSGLKITMQNMSLDDLEKVRSRIERVIMKLGILDSDIYLALQLKRP